MWPRAYYIVHVQCKSKWKNKANQLSQYEHVPTILKKNIRNHSEFLNFIGSEPEVLQNETRVIIKNECEKKLPKTKKQSKLNIKQIEIAKKRSQSPKKQKSQEVV